MHSLNLMHNLCILHDLFLFVSPCSKANVSSKTNALRLSVCISEKFARNIEKNCCCHNIFSLVQP